MRQGARRRIRQVQRVLALAGLAIVVLPFSIPAIAQIGPIYHDGFLEYQYRLNRVEQGGGNELQLATWRAQASTWVWRPYILQVDASLGLTRTRNSADDSSNTGNIITGTLAANAFARSHFPFRIFFESRDNRVDGDVFDVDRTTRNWGFLQQFAPRGGGRVSLDFRQSDNEELHVDGNRSLRRFGTEIWQLNGVKAIGRNEFRLTTSLRHLDRDAPAQSEDRFIFNLRHRFRTGQRFFVEDTTFYSDEQVQLNGTETNRRFLQFNGMSTWRPKTRRPLMVIARALAQGMESGPDGFESGSTNVILTGTATYQYTHNLTFAGSLSAANLDPDNATDESSVQQRLRATYRADAISLGSMDYTWGGSVEAGNRRARTNGNDTVQDIAGNFGHSLSRIAALSGGRQFQVTFSQTVAAIADTDDRRVQSLVNSAFMTLNRQQGRTSSYLRIAASDRRAFGDRENSFQLVTLQASSRMQINRRRSLNGGLTLQYSNNSIDMSGEQDQDNASFTYGADLSYIERDLFKVPRLNFLSELRLLSREFRSNDILDQGMETDPDRRDKAWRNELDYRIGLLEFRLLADVREIDNQWLSQVYFQVRRYYGSM